MNIEQIQRLDRILAQRARALEMMRGIIDREASAAGIRCTTASTPHILRVELLDQTVTIRILVDERGGVVTRLETFESHGGVRLEGRSH
jgi:hypothetical protein